MNCGVAQVQFLTLNSSLLYQWPGVEAKDGLSKFASQSQIALTVDFLFAQIWLSEIIRQFDRINREIPLFMKGDKKDEITYLEKGNTPRKPG